MLVTRDQISIVIKTSIKICTFRNSIPIIVNQNHQINCFQYLWSFHFFHRNQDYLLGIRGPIFTNLVHVIDNVLIKKRTNIDWWNNRHNEQRCRSLLFIVSTKHFVYFNKFSSTYLDDHCIEHLNLNICLISMLLPWKELLYISS